MNLPEEGLTLRYFFRNNLDIRAETLAQNIAGEKLDLDKSTVTPFGKVKDRNRSRGQAIRIDYVTESGEEGSKDIFALELKEGERVCPLDVMSYQGYLHTLCFLDWKQRNRTIFPQTVAAVDWGERYLILEFNPDPSVRNYVESLDSDNASKLEETLRLHKEGVELMADFQRAMTLNQHRLNEEINRGQVVQEYFTDTSIVEQRLHAYLGRILEDDQTTTARLIDKGFAKVVLEYLSPEIPGMPNFVCHGDFKDTNLHIGILLTLLDLGSVRQGHGIIDLAAWDNSPSFSGIQRHYNTVSFYRYLMDGLPEEALEDLETKYAVASVWDNLRKLAYPNGHKKLYARHLFEASNKFPNKGIRKIIQEISAPIALA